MLTWVPYVMTVLAPSAQRAEMGMQTFCLLLISWLPAVVMFHTYSCCLAGLRGQPDCLQWLRMARVLSPLPCVANYGACAPSSAVARPLWLALCHSHTCDSVSPVLSLMLGVHCFCQHTQGTKRRDSVHRAV